MSLARDVTTVGSATLGSRLLGFARDMGIAALLGAGVFSDAFFAVLQITNFFRRLLAEGALNAAFVPLWLRIKQIEGRAGAQRFFQQVFSATLLVGGVLAAGALWFAPALIGLLAPGFDGERHALATEYLRIVAPYLALAGIVAVLAAALNAQGRMVAAGLGTVAFNVVLLLALAWIAGLGVTQPSAVGAILAYAILLAGIVQLVVTGAGFLQLRRSTGSAGKAGTGSRREAPRWLRGCIHFSPDARRFFVLAVPGLVAAGIPQLKLIAGAMVASSSQAAVSWLYYANRLYELPLGVDLDRHGFGAGAGDRRERAQRRQRGERGGAIARVRDCDRPGASLPRSASRCWRSRSPPRCSSAAPSGRAIPQPSPRRSRRSAPACPATRSRRYSARCRSRMRTRARRCLLRSPGLRRPSSDRLLCFPATATSAWRRRLRFPAGSAR